MMLNQKTIVLLSPGSGMGHLVRSAAVGVFLKELGHQVKIVSSSVFTEGFSRILGLAAVRIPLNQWKAKILSVLNKLEPILIVQDTFPFGLKGELLSGLSEKIPFVYMARRLHMSAYMKAVDVACHSRLSMVRYTLICEPLSMDHRSYINKSDSEVAELNGRIVFPSHTIDLPETDQLKKLCKESPTVLIVHSGPVHEVRKLVSQAADTMKSSDTVLIINPFMEEIPETKNCLAVDYFPAVHLYPHVEKIVTGCGYNTIAETFGFSDKHVAIPFDRYYDDQKGRYDERMLWQQDATRKAATIINDIVS